MSSRRLISVLGVVVVSSGIVAAQPKTPAKAPAPAPAPAPAKEPDPAAGSGAGSAVAPIEDAPPSDMEGTNENPDAPRGTGMGEEVTPPTTGPAPTVKAGYPVEEALRPITLPANMAEVSIAPHFRVSPFAGGDALRARYGITPKVQLGLTYLFAGIYDDPATVTKKYTFHVGKAAGLDVTVLLQNWVGVRIGVPVYLDPFAISVQLGAPMKFKFTDKFALGILDDLLNIALPLEAQFAPSLYQELFNAQAADRDATLSTQSRGQLRFSGYGVYQHKPNTALIGRLALEIDDFATNRNTRGYGGITTSIRAGVQHSPKKFLDVGGSLGFDDLSQVGSFGLAGYLAVRI